MSDLNRLYGPAPICRADRHIVSFPLGDVTVNPIDTPGHPDFIAEVEHVLAGAVLDVLRARLAPLSVAMTAVTGCVAMTAVTGLGTRAAADPRLADHDEDLLAAYVDERPSPRARLHRTLVRQARAGLVHPVYSGSACSRGSAASASGRARRHFPPPSLETVVVPARPADRGALHAALKRAGTRVHERFHLEISAGLLGAVLPRLRAVPSGSLPHGDTYRIEGTVPAARVHELEQALPSLTRGEGVLETAFDRHRQGPPPHRPRPARPEGVLRMV